MILDLSRALSEVYFLTYKSVHHSTLLVSFMGCLGGQNRDYVWKCFLMETKIRRCQVWAISSNEVGRVVPSESFYFDSAFHSSHSITLQRIIACITPLWLPSLKVHTQQQWASEWGRSSLFPAGLQSTDSQCFSTLESPGGFKHTRV